MKAAVIHEFGDVNVLKYEDVETPKSKPSHVLIKVLAAGVNRLDVLDNRNEVTRIDHSELCVVRIPIGTIDVSNS